MFDHVFRTRFICSLHYDNRHTNMIVSTKYSRATHKQVFDAS